MASINDSYNNRDSTKDPLITSPYGKIEESKNEDDYNTEDETIIGKVEILVYMCIIDLDFLPSELHCQQIQGWLSKGKYLYTYYCYYRNRLRIFFAPIYLNRYPVDSKLYWSIRNGMGLNANVYLWFSRILFIDARGMQETCIGEINIFRFVLLKKEKPIPIKNWPSLPSENPSELLLTLSSSSQTGVLLLPTSF